MRKKTAFLCLVLLSSVALCELPSDSEFYRHASPEDLLQAVINHTLSVRSEAALEPAINEAVQQAVQMQGEAEPGTLLSKVRGLLDQEFWEVQETHSFPIWESLWRSQGTTTDQQGHYFYASQYSLLRADSIDDDASAFHFLPLPDFMTDLGDNHIGDLDYANGKLFLAIEDGSNYQHPFLGVYDPDTLEIVQSAPLPVAQQIDGVPWVAADGQAHRLYSAQYHDTTKINIYDMDDLSPRGQIQIQGTLQSVQGGKVHNGFLYLTANAPEAGYAVYKLNLQTGQLIQVAQMPAELVEVEGLSFDSTRHEAELSVMGVIPFFSNGSFKFLRYMKRFGFHQTQVSVRDQLRQRLAVPVSRSPAGE